MIFFYSPKFKVDFKIDILLKQVLSVENIKIKEYFLNKLSDLILFFEKEGDNKSDFELRTLKIINKWWNCRQDCVNQLLLEKFEDVELKMKINDLNEIFSIIWDKKISSLISIPVQILSNPSSNRYLKRFICSKIVGFLKGDYYIQNKVKIVEFLEEERFRYLQKIDKSPDVIEFIKKNGGVY